MWMYCNFINNLHALILYEIFIFNRWGEVIFSSENMDERWDGTVGDSKIIPVGQYSYVINVVDEMEVSHIFKGNLLLQK